MLIFTVLCTGLASYAYMRMELVQDRSAILEAELDRRSQQLNSTLRARIQTVRALAARRNTARAINIYESEGASAIERTNALMALQLTAGNLLEAGSLRAIELRSLEGHRLTSAASLPSLPSLSVPILQGDYALYWDNGFILRVAVDIIGEEGTTGKMLADVQVAEADAAIMGTERLGETGEVGLCGLKGTSKVCFPSRFQPAGSVTKAEATPSRPSDRALAGQQGTIQVKDYRRVATFSSFRPLGELGLALVVKVDKAELLAPVRRHLTFGFPVLLLIASAGAGLIRKRLEPLTAELVTAKLRADAEVVSRTLAEAEVRLGKRQLQLVADNASFLIAFLDPTFVFRFANRPHELWFGRPVEQIIGQPLQVLVGEVSAGQYRQAMAAALATGVPQKLSHDTIINDVVRVIELTFWAQNEEGKLEGYCLTARDATENVAREQSLLLAARRDPLTGLCNRTAFNERLEEALRNIDVAPRSLAVAYLDVDHFKSVNDRFGHDAGDRYLNELGRRIEGALMHSDTVARVGGDEFALILRLAAPRDVRVVSSNLLTSIRTPLSLDDHSLEPSVSIGFAIARSGDSTATLLKRADLALYEAKNRGRNDVVLMDSDMVSGNYCETQAQS